MNLTTIKLLLACVVFEPINKFRIADETYVMTSIINFV